MLYYQNYEVPEKDRLSNEENYVLYACHWMVDNRSTIRETAVKYGYSATTFWRRIHNECRQLSPELYRCVVRQMQKNLERRGKSNGFDGSKDYKVRLFSC